MADSIESRERYFPSVKKEFPQISHSYTLIKNRSQKDENFSFFGSFSMVIDKRRLNYGICASR